MQADSILEFRARQETSKVNMRSNIGGQCVMWFLLTKYCCITNILNILKYFDANSPGWSPNLCGCIRLKGERSVCVETEILAIWFWFKRMNIKEKKYKCANEDVGVAIKQVVLISITYVALLLFLIYFPFNLCLV